MLVITIMLARVVVVNLGVKGNRGMIRTQGKEKFIFIMQKYHDFIMIIFFRLLAFQFSCEILNSF